MSNLQIIALLIIVMSGGSLLASFIALLYLCRLNKIDELFKNQKKILKNIYLYSTWSTLLIGSYHLYYDQNAWGAKITQIGLVLLILWAGFQAILKIVAYVYMTHYQTTQRNEEGQSDDRLTKEDDHQEEESEEYESMYTVDEDWTEMDEKEYQSILFHGLLKSLVTSSVIIVLLSFLYYLISINL